MTDTEFQGRVLRELGDINTKLAVVVERQSAQARRIMAVEAWQDAADNKAEKTGEHELAKLRCELQKRQQQQKTAAQASRAAWLGWVGKAALLVMGSALAMAAPACQQLVGW